MYETTHILRLVRPVVVALEVGLAATPALPGGGMRRLGRPGKSRKQGTLGNMCTLRRPRRPGIGGVAARPTSMANTKNRTNLGICVVS